MFRLLSFQFARRTASLQLPVLMLIALLQRTPVLRLLASAESVWVSSSLGQVLKATAVVATMLGAVDTLAGATGLVTDPANPAEATVGVPFAAVFAYLGGASSADSYLLSNLPPGLSVPGSFSATNGRGINSSSGGGITGTPTQAGDYEVSITAFDNANLDPNGPHTFAITTYTISVGASEVGPAITSQPSSLTVTAGLQAMFSVAATGSPAPTYQWKKGGVPIAGATNSSYTIASTVVGDAGNYTVVATNLAGSATSNAATLTVNATSAAPAITTQPQSQVVVAGAAVTFTAAASGNPTPTFQWQKNSVNISGATSSSYTISVPTGSDSGNYRSIATNNAGSATSVAALLTVIVAPSSAVITISVE